MVVECGSTVAITIYHDRMSPDGALDTQQNRITRVQIWIKHTDQSGAKVRLVVRAPNGVGEMEGTGQWDIGREKRRGGAAAGVLHVDRGACVSEQCTDGQALGRGWGVGRDRGHAAPHVGPAKAVAPAQGI